MSAGRNEMTRKEFRERVRLTGAIGPSLIRCVAISLVVAVTVVTGFAGVARAEFGAGAAEWPRAMELEAEAIQGGALLSCGGAILGGLMIGGTLWGAFVGALMIACGCDNELDRMFNTNFTGACA